MGFSGRLPRVFAHVSESHPHVAAALRQLEGVGIPRSRGMALIRSLMVHAVEDLGGSYMRDMTRRLERIEAIRGRVSDAVEHVVQEGVLPDGMDHAGFSALFGELQREMDGLASVQKHIGGMSPEATAQRALDGAAGTPPPPPRQGQVAPHPPESLAAAMDAARAQHPAGAALIDEILRNPEHGDLLGLALAAEHSGSRNSRLAELARARNLSPDQQRELAQAVDAMGLARARMQRVDPAALARRHAAVAGLPAELAREVMGDNTVLGPLAEGSREQLLDYWKHWNNNDVKGSFRKYVDREMASDIRPMVSEWGAAQHLGSQLGAGLLKDAAAFDPKLPGNRRVRPRDPGTDILLMRDNGVLWYVDDKAHRGEVTGMGPEGPERAKVLLSGVSAFEGLRFLENIRDDIRDIESAMRRQRETGQIPHARMGEGLARLRAVADELDPLMRGWTKEQSVLPENLRAVRSVLDRHRVALRVTSELGDVTGMTDRLKELGIRVIPPIGRGTSE